MCMCALYIDILLSGWKAKLNFELNVGAMVITLRMWNKTKNVNIVNWPNYKLLLVPIHKKM